LQNKKLKFDLLEGVFKNKVANSSHNQQVAHSNKSVKDSQILFQFSKPVQSNLITKREDNHLSIDLTPSLMAIWQEKSAKDK